MKTFTRKCVKDLTQGDLHLLKLDTKYITSDVLKDGFVMVFTKYWFRVPLEYFCGEEPFTTA